MSEHPQMSENQESDATAQPGVAGGGGGVSRRAVLAGGALTALGLSLGSAGGFAFGMGRGEERGLEQADVMALQYPFRGEHQPGILTPQQQQMHTAAYNLTANTRDAFIDLLKDWSRAAENMMAGHLINDPKVTKNVAPDDTGETMGYGPGALTITIGFGPGVFVDEKGKDRYGLAKHLTPALEAGIPRMAAEYLDPVRCGGDLIVQACAEDPMVALHAIHNMTRIAFGRAVVKWTQLGYGRTSSTSTAQQTPRNLFGFKDGTSNIKAEDAPSELDEHLWIQPGDAGGDVFAGGSYLCVRKIKQLMEAWDGLILSDQEQFVGRDKLHGAPLSLGEGRLAGGEFKTPDFSAKDSEGNPLIDVNSHVARVHPKNNGGRRMLRRGYNYMEGNDKLGRLEGGLFFIAYVRDPQTNFIPILQRMSTDLMTEYLQHIGSGLYLCPPGVREGQTFLAEAMFA